MSLATVLPESTSAAAPWYRHRWPWLLIAGPAVAVVASFVSAWFAVTTDDGVIADDYYKRGLLINRDLVRSQRAETMGLSAVLHVAPSGAVSLDLAAATPDAVLPIAVTLKLVHPTRAGLDREAVLTRGPGGAYIGNLGAVPGRRWLASIETPEWRLPATEFTEGLADARFQVPHASN